MYFILSFWGWLQFNVPIEDKQVTRESGYLWCTTIFIGVLSHLMPGSLLIFPWFFCNGCYSFELPFLMPRVNDKKLVSLQLEQDLTFKESTIPEIWIFKVISCSNCRSCWELDLTWDSKDDDNGYNLGPIKGT